MRGPGPRRADRLPGAEPACGDPGSAGPPKGIVPGRRRGDRGGNAGGNGAMSTRRANCVRYCLLEKGGPADMITAVGRGSVEPVVECEDQDRDALIACLAPNRRVEIRVVPVR